jgi:hypothetical protein
MIGGDFGLFQPGQRAERMKAPSRTDAPSKRACSGLQPLRQPSVDRHSDDLKKNLALISKAALNLVQPIVDFQATAIFHDGAGAI